MRERKLGIDVLKITATLMVVVLHVNGYLYDTVSFENFSFRSLFLWHSLEAFAYPAIHLFVMITAYLSLDKKNISIIKSGTHTWMQTIIICICGLVIAIAFRIPYSYKDMFSCVFPFLGRAYWYVSDILVFLILIPVLNDCLKKMSTNQLKYLTAVLFCLISIFPTFLFSLNWKQDYSNIGLFILLYFVVALIKRLEIGDMKIGGGMVPFLSATLL